MQLVGDRTQCPRLDPGPRLRFSINGVWYGQPAHNNRALIIVTKFLKRFPLTQSIWGVTVSPSIALLIGLCTKIELLLIS